MSNSPLVSYTKLSPNYNTRTQKITKITPHYMAGDLSIETCGNVFAPASRQASSNYGIGSDGRIGMYVEERNRAWTSSSAANDQRAVTIEVANKADSSITEAAWNALVDLCVDICQRNGIEGLTWTGDASGTLTCHYMFAATSCPGAYLKGKMGQLAEEVNEKLGNGYKPTATTSTTASAGESIDDLARRVIAGDFGNGDARKAALGSDYDAVQTRVNEMLGVASTSSQAVAASTNSTANRIDELARRVINGEFGNGDARRQALGSDYDAVQARVNEMLGGSNRTAKSYSIDDLARQVIRGDWGNGSERRQRLEAAGYDYQAIQARVNQLC